MLLRRGCVMIASLLLATALPACPVCVHGGNWPFKIGTDPQARDVSLVPKLTTIDAMRAVPYVPRPPKGRIGPTELETYTLRDVRFESFQRAPDGDIHMVLADEHGHTMIAEAAPPTCADPSSPWYARIVEVRNAVEAVLGPELANTTPLYVSMSGVGYIDSVHGQPGVAPNGIEIHPVLAVCFGKGCALPGLDAPQDRATNASR